MTKIKRKIGVKKLKKEKQKISKSLTKYSNID